MNNKGFDAVEDRMGGSMLIEASAGTGKTYSIAILVLRILLQQRRINIEEILMVTFTKAAVAELESRIRLFVRHAYKHVTEKETLDEENNIRKVVDKSELGKKEQVERLKKALQSLDAISVMTIHSFCQQTIEEFTFETGQSFDFEIMTNDADLLNSQANIFIREKLNVLDPETRKKLKKELSLKDMPDLLGKHMKGMNFIDYSEDENPEVDSLQKELDRLNNEFESYLKEVYPEIIEKNLKTNAIHKAAVAEDFENFVKNYGRQVKKETPDKYFPAYEFMREEFLQHFEKLETKKEEVNDAISRAERHAINFQYVEFFKTAEERLKKIKSQKGYISYDDQIRTIHRVRKNADLIRKLRTKYKAVFVDEFQDTDKHQYEIFHQVFQDEGFGDEEQPMVFYIGDPKQAIYSWRGADLDTYKKAGDEVEHKAAEMKYNFRSTEKMLDALNIALDPGGDFDLFLDDDILYKRVEAGNNSLGSMKDAGKEVVPISVWKFRQDDETSSFRAVANEIFRLLKEDSEVRINGNRIMPEDIGILVRDNREGEQMKRILERYNIPAIKRDDKKVFDSDEARMIKFLLEAVITPKRGDIVRVLLSPWLAYSHESIQLINDEEHLEIFRMGITLKDEGVYNMIASFLNKYNVRARCMKALEGQRVLTNINHIAEILHLVERKSKCSPEELLVWMERAADDGMEEYEQRIESDDNAVQISTIHKAKGLEYKIVFAPGLCMIPKFSRQNKKKINDFKKEDEYWFTFDFPSLSDEDKELHNIQKEQENRRLIYVALTRAVYKLYISYMEKTYYSNVKESSIDDLVNAWENMGSPLIEIEDFKEQMIPYQNGFSDNMPEERSFKSQTVHDLVIKNKFGVHSYSGIGHKNKPAPFEKTEPGKGDKYDQFIFQDLQRGANAGTALHSIFEYLDFNDEASWAKSLQDASVFYKNIIKEAQLDHFMTMVQHVMKTEIEIGDEKFRLAEVSNEHILPELEFLFSIDKVNRQVLNEVLGELAEIGGESDLEGLMTGFIDLFFEHNGKYYILDWKSNHLGNSINNYDRAGMEEAMKGSNYNLQYMIYTVALKRWLKTKIPDFDYDKHFGGVVYVFLRGVREGEKTGFYTSLPSIDKIEKLDRALKS